MICDTVQLGAFLPRYIYFRRKQFSLASPVRILNTYFVSLKNVIFSAAVLVTVTHSPVEFFVPKNAYLQVKLSLCNIMRYFSSRPEILSRENALGTH